MQHQRVRSACLPVTTSSSSTASQMHLRQSNYPQVQIGRFFVVFDIKSLTQNSQK